MKKIISLIALTLCTCTALAQEPPSKKEMEAVDSCVASAGISLPKPGEGKPPKLTKKQKAIIDNCFEKNGLTRLTEHLDKKEAIHQCVTNAGIDMPKPKEGRPPELTKKQKAIIDSCLEKNGVEPPNSMN